METEVLFQIISNTFLQLFISNFINLTFIKEYVSPSFLNSYSLQSLHRTSVTNDSIKQPAKLKYESAID